MSEDGMKMFGVLDLETTFEGCRFSIGVRNANDKSMRLVRKTSGCAGIAWSRRKSAFCGGPAGFTVSTSVAVPVPLAFVAESVTIREMTERLSQLHGEELDRKITPRWVGYIVRRKLGIKTYRRAGSYFIAQSERTKLERLFERYGLIGEDA